VEAQEAIDGLGGHDLTLQQIRLVYYLVISGGLPKTEVWRAMEAENQMLLGPG
jgi:hypothetical protein